MRKLYAVMFFALIFLASNSYIAMAYEKEINRLSTAMADKIANSGKKTIAVVDFTELHGNVTELGRFLAEEFSVALAASGKGFEVVDRSHLRVLLQEHKLSLTGLVEPKTARKLGKIAGVEALITGTLTPFGDSVRIAIKILDTNTAKLISGTTGNIAKTKAIEELLAREIEPSTLTASGTAATTLTPVRKPVLKKGGIVDVGRFLIEIESLKVLTRGRLMVALAYINKTKQEFEITLDHKSKESAFASDDAGNEYTLEKSTGMERRHSDPNYDLKNPVYNVHCHSTFLLCSPGKRARAGFLFKTASSKRAEIDVKKLGTFTISIAHYARPTKDFDPEKSRGAFGFSATISNVQPD